MARPRLTVNIRRQTNMELCTASTHTPLEAHGTPRLVQPLSGWSRHNAGILWRRFTYSTRRGGIYWPICAGNWGWQLCGTRRSHHEWDIHIKHARRYPSPTTPGLLVQLSVGHLARRRSADERRSQRVASGRHGDRCWACPNVGVMAQPGWGKCFGFVCAWLGSTGLTMAVRNLNQ